MKSLSHIVTHFPWRAYGLLVFVLYFGHWLGATAVHWIEEATHEFPHHHLWLTAILSGVVLTVLVVTLHHLHHRYRRPKSVLLRLSLWSLSTIVVVVAYCAATFGEHAALSIGFLKSSTLVFVALCLAGMAAVSHVLRDILRSIEGPEDIQVTAYSEDAAKSLILHVSLVAKDAVSFDEPDFATVTIKSRSGTTDPDRICILKGNDLTEDITALHNTNWPWQQLLRAIQPHRSLRKVILIGSKPGGNRSGSFDLVPTCAKLLAPYVPDGCQVQIHSEPVPFEDFNSIKRTLRDIVLSEARTFGEGSVVIDVTGGQATTSIAAAAATIGTEAIFQYVQTSEPHEVVFYDIHNAHVPNPHGH